VISRDACAAVAAPRAQRRPEAGEPDSSAPPIRARAPAPQPVLIGAAGHTCLAWWHAPAAAVRTQPELPLAVVLASSWGEEDMAGYDGQRALAVALAESGLGTLRFEWPDTGDSSAPTGTTTIADALAAFDAAARQALACSGRERLAFVGLRLGALLAAHAATARVDVDALVALVPVSGGRAFVREQVVRQGDLPAQAPARLPGTLFDPARLPVSLGGFAMSVRRLEALSALKWPAAATTSVLEALLLWPPRAPGRVAADALARMGMRVRERAHEDPAGGVAVAEVVRWLQERARDATVTHGVLAIEGFGVADPANGRTHAALGAARLEAATTAVLALSAADAPVWMRLREGHAAVRERVVRIDDARGPALAGVLGERDPGDACAGACAPRRGILLLSSDRARRVGPHRLWVPWARHRAALGDVVLRLDAAGVGDSDAADRDDSRAVADVARALAWLRREQGVGACTVVGVGAGARHAWRAALGDVDVQTIVAVDPTALCWPPRGSPAPGAETSNALVARARQALRRRVRGVSRLLRRSVEDGQAAALARACARGVSLNLVSSCSDGGLALMRDALGRRARALVRDGQVTVCAIAHATPGFAGLAGRAALYARLDALVSPAQAGAAFDTSADRHRAAAVQALRAIARSAPPAA
jgi:hypothetical protein